MFLAIPACQTAAVLIFNSSFIIQNIQCRLKSSPLYNLFHNYLDNRSYSLFHKCFHMKNRIDHNNGQNRYYYNLKNKQLSIQSIQMFLRHNFHHKSRHCHSYHLLSWFHVLQYFCIPFCTFLGMLLDSSLYIRSDNYPRKILHTFPHM